MLLVPKSISLAVDAVLIIVDAVDVLKLIEIGKQSRKNQMGLVVEDKETELIIMSLNSLNK